MSSSSITNNNYFFQAWGDELKFCLKERMNQILANVNTAIDDERYPGADKAKAAATFIFTLDTFSHNINLMVDKIVTAMTPNVEAQDQKDELDSLDTNNLRYAYLQRKIDMIDTHLALIIKKAAKKKTIQDKNRRMPTQFCQS